jgi:uncharacterized membrane protein (GlpM family)
MSGGRGEATPCRAFCRCFRPFAAIALVIVGARAKMPGSGNPAPVRKTFPAFLAACYFGVAGVDYRIALIGGLAAWFVVALGIFLAPR